MHRGPVFVRSTITPLAAMVPPQRTLTPPLAVICAGTIPIPPTASGLSITPTPHALWERCSPVTHSVITENLLCCPALARRSSLGRPSTTHCWISCIHRGSLSLPLRNIPDFCRERWQARLVGVPWFRARPGVLREGTREAALYPWHGCSCGRRAQYLSSSRELPASSAR